MPTTPEQLFACLDRLGIDHKTFDHPPVFTAKDEPEWRQKVPGLHCKNLFLVDEKGGLWLVVLPVDKRANLRYLRETLGAPRFSFGKPALLLSVLGVIAGSVTPFALINDTEKRVTVVLDADMMKSERVNYHPLHNAASTVIRSADLLKFLKALGYSPQIVDCGAADGGIGIK